MERTHTHTHTQRQSGKNLGAYTKCYVYVVFYSSLCLTSAEPLSPRVKVCGIGLVRFTLMHTHTPMAEPPSIHKRNKPKLQASKAHIHTHTRRVRRTRRRLDMDRSLFLSPFASPLRLILPPPNLFRVVAALRHLCIMMMMMISRTPGAPFDNNKPTMTGNSMFTMYERNISHFNNVFFVVLHGAQMEHRTRRDANRCENRHTVTNTHKSRRATARVDRNDDDGATRFVSSSSCVFDETNSWWARRRE